MALDLASLSSLNRVKDRLKMSSHFAGSNMAAGIKLSTMGHKNSRNSAA